MEYLTIEELNRLLAEAEKINPRHRLAIATMFRYGMRVTELIQLRGTDIADGQVFIRRLKGSDTSLHPLYPCPSLLDTSELQTIAAQVGEGRIFQFSRQRVDQFVKRYGAAAGIHPNKCHAHSLKHSTAMTIWDKLHSLGPIRNYLGHRASSSTLQYLREVNARKAQSAMAEIQ